MSAPTPASAGSATLDTTGGVIFSASANGGACSAFGITNRDSTNDLLVNVSGLHSVGEFRSVAPGASYTFGLGGNNYSAITTVFAKAALNTALANWSVDGRR